MNNLDIKEIREKLKVSQETLAEMLGVHPRTVQNWEGGSKIPHSKYAILRNLLAHPTNEQNVHGDNNVTVNNSEMGKLIDLLAQKEMSLSKAQDHITKLLDLLGK